VSSKFGDNSKNDPNQNFGFVVFKEYSVASNVARTLNFIWSANISMVASLVN